MKSRRFKEYKNEGTFMYKLRSTIKCPVEMKEHFLEELKKLQIEDPKVEVIEYGKFIDESRLYWDYVYPEMLEEGKDVLYISYEFPDTPEGRKACHKAEWSIGWVPQNIRYVKE